MHNKLELLQGLVFKVLDSIGDRDMQFLACSQTVMTVQDDIVLVQVQNVKNSVVGDGVEVLVTPSSVAGMVSPPL